MNMKGNIKTLHIGRFDVVVCCSVLQCGVVCQYEEQYEDSSYQYPCRICCSVLQCVNMKSNMKTLHTNINAEYVVVCCSVLQCVAVCCSVV